MLVSAATARLRGGVPSPAGIVLRTRVPVPDSAATAREPADGFSPTVRRRVDRASAGPPVDRVAADAPVDLGARVAEVEPSAAVLPMAGILPLGTTLPVAAVLLPAVVLVTAVVLVAVVVLVPAVVRVPAGVLVPATVALRARVVGGSVADAAVFRAADPDRPTVVAACEVAARPAAVPVAGFAAADLDAVREATDREVDDLAGSAAAVPVRADFFALPARAVTTPFAEVAAAADVFFARVGSVRARRPAADAFVLFAGSGEAFVAFAITKASLPRLSARHSRIAFPTGRTAQHRYRAGPVSGLSLRRGQAYGAHPRVVNVCWTITGAGPPALGHPSW